MVEKGKGEGRERGMEVSPLIEVTIKRVKFKIGAPRNYYYLLCVTKFGRYETYPILCETLPT